MSPVGPPSVLVGLIKEGFAHLYPIVIIVVALIIISVIGNNLSKTGADPSVFSGSFT